MSTLPDGITVPGVGTATAAPDVLQFTVTAVARASSVAAAMQQSSAALRQCRSVLQASGVEQRDLATSHLDLDDAYDAEGRPAGYLARFSLTVTMRELGAPGRAGRLLATAADAGGDLIRISGLRYDVEDRGALLRVARERAWTDAHARAQQLAVACGRPLGPVLAVGEGAPTDSPYGGRPSAAAAETASLDIPVLDPGTATISVRLDVRWQLRVS